MGLHRLLVERIARPPRIVEAVIPLPRCKIGYPGVDPKLLHPEAGYLLVRHLRPLEHQVHHRLCGRTDVTELCCSDSLEARYVLVVGDLALWFAASVGAAGKRAWRHLAGKHLQQLLYRVLIALQVIRDLSRDGFVLRGLSHFSPLYRRCLARQSDHESTAAVERDSRRRQRPPNTRSPQRPLSSMPHGASSQTCLHPGHRFLVIIAWDVYR